MANPTLELYSCVFHVLTIHTRSTTWSYSNEDAIAQEMKQGGLRRPVCNNCLCACACFICMPRCAGSYHGTVEQIVASARHTRRRESPWDLVSWCSPRHARMVRRDWWPSPYRDIPLGTGGNTGRVLVVSKASSSVAGCDLDGAGIIILRGHQRRVWASPGSLR
ncbi:hypothetical protein H4582DRAFT_143080 [Lactarius indigo]|nr:hypothetical protein H4582DRAFT_143080 [Lactarius indigo]